MASAELQIPEHIQETQNITREELEMILHTQNPLVTDLTSYALIASITTFV